MVGLAPSIRDCRQRQVCVIFIGHAGREAGIGQGLRKLGGQQVLRIVRMKDRRDVNRALVREVTLELVAAFLRRCVAIDLTAWASAKPLIHARDAKMTIADFMMKTLKAQSPAIGCAERGPSVEMSRPSRVRS